MTNPRVTRTIAVDGESTREGFAVLTTVASTCTDGQTCPAIYTDEEETVLVRGYVAQHPELALPDGEALVRVPRSLLDEATRKLQR